MKYSLVIFAILTAFILAPSQWNTANAQTAISFSFSGTGGLNSGGGVVLSGTGTLNPYGPTTIVVTLINAGSTTLTIVVTFADGSTWSAVAPNQVTGTATITGGTGRFLGVSGSFNYNFNYNNVTSNTSQTTINFTVPGSGTLIGGPPVSVSYYFSDLAFAGGYQTTLTYINLGTQPVTCTTNFYNDSGTSLPIPFAQGTILTRTDVIPPGGSLHDQTTANLNATVTEGWAQASCTGVVQANLLYRLYQSGTAVGEASVNAETVPASKFVTFAQAATGIAYANPSASQSASITFTAFSGTGAQVASKTITLGPLAHSSANIGPLLGQANFTGSLQITSTIPIISLSLNAEAFPVFSSLPPGDLPSVALTGTQSYYFSDLAFAGGYQTTLTYINYGTQSVTCTTNFFADSGALLSIPFTQGTISTRTDILPPGGSIHDQTTANLNATATEGWARTSCTGPVQASLLYRLYQAGTAAGEASVNAEAAPTSKFITFAQAATGVAYANPSTTQSASITVAVFSVAGISLGSKVVTLGPLAHTAANVGPLLGLTNFTGSIALTSTVPIISLSLNAEAFPVFSSLPPGDL